MLRRQVPSRLNWSKASIPSPPAWSQKDCAGGFYFKITPTESHHGALQRPAGMIVHPARIAAYDRRTAHGALCATASATHAATAWLPTLTVTTPYGMAHPFGRRSIPFSRRPNPQHVATVNKFFFFFFFFYPLGVGAIPPETQPHPPSARGKHHRGVSP